MQRALSLPSQSSPSHSRGKSRFSDGRQKAARLARDLPREVECDFLREARIGALKELADIGRDPVPDETLYAAFVLVCARHHLHFFDGQDQKALLEDCHRLERDYDLDLDLALQDGWKATPRIRFRQALLRQISDPYDSLIAACAVVVQPRKSKLSLSSTRDSSVGGDGRAS